MFSNVYLIKYTMVPDNMTWMRTIITTNNKHSKPFPIAVLVQIMAGIKRCAVDISDESYYKALSLLPVTRGSELVDYDNEKCKRLKMTNTPNWTKGDPAAALH